MRACSRRKGTRREQAKNAGGGLVVNAPPPPQTPRLSRSHVHNLPLTLKRQAFEHSSVVPLQREGREFLLSVAGSEGACSFLPMLLLLLLLAVTEDEEEAPLASCWFGLVLFCVFSAF